MHGLALNFDSTRDAGTGFTFADATQQQNGLRRTQVCASEHRATVERVYSITFGTTIDSQFTLFQFAEDTRFLATDSSVGTSTHAGENT